jgi:hypothetical protein
MLVLQVETVLEAESQRVLTLMNVSTLPKVVSACKQVLLEAHMEELLSRPSGFANILRELPESSEGAGAGGAADKVRWLPCR